MSSSSEVAEVATEGDVRGLIGQLSMRAHCLPSSPWPDAVRRHCKRWKHDWEGWSVRPNIRH